MEAIKKQKIAAELRLYAQRHGSQSRAAKALRMSAGMVSQMLTGDWDRISDQQWLAAASGMGYRSERWEAVETAAFARLQAVLADAQQNALVMALTGAAGLGKSFGAAHYAATHGRCYTVSCDGHWTRRDLLEELLRAMGEDSAGLTLSGMMRRAVQRLRTEEGPLLVLDEADKLGDRALTSLITLYNQLEGICGMVLMATSHLEKRLQTGVRCNKQGYNELWSRVGRRCVGLGAVSARDIVLVCEANGVADTRAIDAIVADSDGDLRRVARKVHAWRRTHGPKAGDAADGGRASAEVVERKEAKKGRASTGSAAEKGRASTGSATANAGSAAEVKGGAR